MSWDESGLGAAASVPPPRLGVWVPLEPGDQRPLSPPGGARFVAAHLSWPPTDRPPTVHAACYHNNRGLLLSVCRALLARRQAVPYGPQVSALGIYDLAERRMVGFYLLNRAAIQRSWGWLL